MKRFRVLVKEIHFQHVVVEAEDAEAAKQAVADGGGDYSDVLEYSDTLDPEGWIVTED